MFVFSLEYTENIKNQQRSTGLSLIINEKQDLVRDLQQKPSSCLYKGSSYKSKL